MCYNMNKGGEVVSQLNAYIGRAGTGKSHAMLNEIKTKMKQDPLGDPIIIIAPTQSTFQLEQDFVKDPELNGSLRTEVLHFERLSHRIFQEIGGLTEEYASKGALEMMIFDILQAHRSELNLYQSQTKYYGFSAKLSEQIQDFKKYAVSPEQLEQFISENQLQTRTQDKLHDIALVYRYLEERLAENFVSSEDTLYKFIEKMSESKWLKRAEIYIDGFHNFSTLEYQIIEKLAQCAKSVSVLLTTNGDKDPFSLFRKTSSTLTHIEEIAQRQNITFNLRRFTKQQRFENHDLSHLEHSFNEVFFEKAAAKGNINILETSNVREEVNTIARDIIRKAREENIRFQDVAVLYRDENYAHLMESVFPEFDIPFNIDTKKSMTHHPVMEMIRSLLEVIESKWSFEPLMRLFKTQVLTKKFRDNRYLTDILENYVLERGIYGQRWLDDKYFKIEQFNQMGLKRQPMTEETEADYQRVIDLKNYVIDKILRFEKALAEADTAETYAAAFYEAFEQFNLPSQLMTERDELDLAGEHQQAEELDQVWNGFIQTLDDLATVFGNREMTQKRFLELFDVGLEQLEFVMIPQTLDQVSIGSMDLAKVDNKKHIYMLGMNDGTMPQAISNSGLISDDEKKYFQEETQLELSPTADVLQMDEAFVCYIAMTRATTHVTLSYSLMGLNNDDKEVSPFINNIQELFTNLDILNVQYAAQHNPLTVMEHPHQTKIALFEELQSWLNHELTADTWLEAYQAMMHNERLNRGLQYLTSALTFDNKTVQLNQPLSKALYGDKINASVSRFEGYQQCPFKHYTSHGLRLNERTKYKLENFDLGDIFHSVLKYIADKIHGDFRNLTDASIRKLTQEALENILPEVQYNLLNSSAYYRYMSVRIGAIVQSTLTALKYQGTFSKFRPQAFEKSFRKNPKSNEQLAAESLYTSQGIPINIRGQIDRIDTFNSKDRSFVNIIDYKSSEYSGTLDLTKVYYGLQMQMMTYMDVVLQNKDRLDLAEATEPGGLLYFHVHEPRVNFANWAEMDEDKRQEELLKSFKLNGLINSDPEVLDAEDTRLEPKFKSDIVPIDIGAKGNLNKSSKVADSQTIYKFIEHNKNNFIQIASDIMDGHTEVAPMKYKQKLPCEYCNYRSVCHVDGMIDSKKYRTVDESINPIDLLNQESDEEDNE
ncbi:putative ATP-dependent nuclease subunit B [Staphylococcus condimenti]|nr:putative ATP-dependent nuclease subunit B [Staphylococcus condimenti]